MAELFTINVDVEGQVLSFKGSTAIASGDQGIDYVGFDFKDETWDGMSDLWAVFNRYGGQPYLVPVVDDAALVPAEVMQKKGLFYIGLFGTDGTNVMTSTVLAFGLKQGSANLQTLEPTPSIYEQFLSDLDAYQTAVADLESIQGDVSTLQGNITDLQTEARNIQRDLDNSQATFEGYVNEAKGYAEYAEQAISGAYTLSFEINEEGHLIMTKEMEG